MAEYRANLAAALGDDIEVLDYSRSIELREAFSDRVHTNARGAGLLLDLMLEDGVFDVRREVDRSDEPVE